MKEGIAMKLNKILLSAVDPLTRVSLNRFNRKSTATFSKNRLISAVFSADRATGLFSVSAFQPKE
jgi:hypothetical protein